MFDLGFIGFGNMGAAIFDSVFKNNCFKKISIIEKNNTAYFLIDTSKVRRKNKNYQLDSHTGAIHSHIFSFIFEDVPLFILNCYITHLLGNFTFVVLMSLIFSGLCVIYKGRTLIHSYWLGCCKM